MPQYLDKQAIIPLLPMQDCISVMERMFRALATGEQAAFINKFVYSGT